MLSHLYSRHRQQRVEPSASEPPCGTVTLCVLRQRLGVPVSPSRRTRSGTISSRFPCPSRCEEVHGGFTCGSRLYVFDPLRASTTPASLPSGSAFEVRVLGRCASRRGRALTIRRCRAWRGTSRVCRDVTSLPFARRLSASGPHRRRSGIPPHVVSRGDEAPSVWPPTRGHVLYRCARIRDDEKCVCHKMFSLDLGTWPMCVLCCGFETMILALCWLARSVTGTTIPLFVEMSCPGLARML